MVKRFYCIINWAQKEEGVVCVLFAPVGDEYACLVLEEAAEALLEDVIANLRIDLREKSKTNSNLKQARNREKQGQRRTEKAFIV